MLPVKTSAKWIKPDGNKIDEDAFKLKSELYHDGTITLISYCAGRGMVVSTVNERKRLLDIYEQMYGEPLRRILDDYVKAAIGVRNRSARHPQ